MRDKPSHLWVDWKVVLGRVVRASGGVSWWDRARERCLWWEDITEVSGARVRV